MNFKSKADYKRWLAYGHMHGQFEKTPGNQPVSIQGKSHPVEHQHVDHTPKNHKRNPG